MQHNPTTRCRSFARAFFAKTNRLPAAATEPAPSKQRMQQLQQARRWRSIKLQFRLKHFCRIRQRQRQSVSVVGRYRPLCLRCVTAAHRGRCGGTSSSSSRGHSVADTQRHTELSERSRSAPSLSLLALDLPFTRALLPTSFRRLSLGAASGIKGGDGRM